MNLAGWISGDGKEWSDLLAAPGARIVFTDAEVVDEIL
jgi:hypothetical protein